MRTWTPYLLLPALVCSASTVSIAASLEVSPTTIEMVSPKAAETISLNNTSANPVNAQIRVQRWLQTDEGEKLVDTTDVVASPPATTIAPGSQQSIRLVRVNKAAPKGEESYRILVNELPSKTPVNGSGVNFTLNYSVPLFVVGAARKSPHLSWGIEKEAGNIVVAAKNSGERRTKVAGLTLKQSGKEFVVGKGLNGYVLAGSRMRWVIPGSVAIGNGPVTIVARDDEGPIHAEAQTGPSR
jgi:fimbrial chaperone protein